MKIQLSPEDTFLLACLRGELWQGAPPCEPKLLARLDYHRVKLLVYHHLLTSGQLDLLSSATQDALHQSYQENTARNLVLSYLVQQMGTYLTKAAIPVLVFKGAHLIEQLPNYGPLRPMVDIDLLVPCHELYRTLDVLSPLATPRHPPQPQLQPYYQWTKNAFTLCITLPELPEVSVDLHWQLFVPLWNFTRWQTPDPWATATFDPVQQVYYFDATDFLLHLVAHCCNDIRIMLYSLVDVVWLVRHQPPDWAVVLPRAQARAVLLHLVNVLRVAHEYLGMALPECYQTQLYPYEQQAEPGYQLLLERLFLKELTESFQVGLVKVRAFRRLESPSPLAHLWSEHLSLNTVKVLRPFKPWIARL